MLPVNLWGRPCDIDAILAVSGKHSLPVVFDSALRHLQENPKFMALIDHPTLVAFQAGGPELHIHAQFVEAVATSRGMETDTVRAIADGAMILVAGALLLTPGFLTDAVGFSLLVPAVRAVLRRWGARRMDRSRCARPGPSGRSSTRARPCAVHARPLTRAWSYAACQRALSYNNPRYGTVKTILAKGLEQHPSAEQAFDTLADSYTGQGRFCRDTQTLLKH